MLTTSMILVGLILVGMWAGGMALSGWRAQRAADRYNNATTKEETEAPRVLTATGPGHTYRLSNTQVWPGTRIFELAHSDYRVWVEHFSEGYEVIDQRPWTVEKRTFAERGEALAYAADLLQQQWDREAGSELRRTYLPF